ncbi:MAG: hypothetical protein AB7K52_02095 [Phycisphaerales bacterium]
MRHLIDTLGGLYELLRLGFITRFRLRGPYWTWRMHTAFGDSPPARNEQVAAVLEYARWVYRTRRGR